MRLDSLVHQSNRLYLDKQNFSVCSFAKVLLLFIAILGFSDRSTCNAQATATAISHENLQMRVADGLKCTLAADDALVHDAFCMTLDPEGRPVVSGPGYIRTLIDANQDGRFESQVTWQSVNEGAQGLWREANTLYYVADQGLWKSIDTNGDLRADGRPELILRLPTGGEHDAHAIRRGPDGFWYLTVGNFSNPQVTPLLNDRNSPIARPKMGTLWRISPDFQTRGVWAHGLRNAYDFDFLPNGEIVTYDSDEEREISLPTYRPTRVSVLSAGSDAGWNSPAWIDDDVRLTMPLTLASLGRGSPTGVCVYRHSTLGAEYQDAVIVLDWTFGRVIAIQPSGQSGNNSEQLCKSTVLLEPAGTDGFAPTDVCVTPTGDLLVVTGGRGTTGNIYRISKADLSVDSSRPEQRKSKQKLVDKDEEPLKFDDLDSEPAKDSDADIVVENAQQEPIKVEPKTDLKLNFISRANRAKTGNPDLLSAARAERLTSILAVTNSSDSCSVARWLPLLDKESLSDVRDFLLGELDLADQEKSANIDRDNSDADATYWDCDSLLMRSAQVLVFAQFPVAADALKPRLQNSSDGIATAAWYVAGRGQLTGSREQIASLAAASLNATVTAEENDWSNTLGGSSRRLRWEAIGLRGWYLPETLPQTKINASESVTTKTSWQALRSQKQMEIWAASQQNLTQNQPLKMVPTSSLVNDLASQIYSQSTGSSPLNVTGFDWLANAIRAGQYQEDPTDILTALCFIQTGMGDPRHAIENGRNPDSASILDGYRSQSTFTIKDAVRDGWAIYCLAIGDKAAARNLPGIEAEAIRTVAFLKPAGSEVLVQLLNHITTDSHPTSDINVLCTIAASNFKPDSTQTQQIAAAYINVFEKITNQALPTDNRWLLRQQQLFDAINQQNPSFSVALVDVLSRQSAGTLDWIDHLPLTQQQLAAKAISQRLLAENPQQWTASQLRSAGRFALLPELAVRLRSVALAGLESPLALETPIGETVTTTESNLPAIVELLAKSPTTADYSVLLASATAPQRLIQQLGWSGLRKLPIVDPQAELVALALLSASHHASPIQGVSLDQIAGRLRNVAARRAIPNAPNASTPWEGWTRFFEPLLTGEKARAQWDKSSQPPAPWIDLVHESLRFSGDSNKGGALFKQGQCAQCHNSAQAIGPSLTGVTRRFSYDDLFLAIYEPNRDVSDRFRATKILTEDGQVIVGMMMLDEAERLTLKLADGTQKIVTKDEIADRAESTASLMPSELLRDWTPEQLADLYGYLQILQ